MHHLAQLGIHLQVGRAPPLQAAAAAAAGESCRLAAVQRWLVRARLAAPGIPRRYLRRLCQAPRRPHLDGGGRHAAVGQPAPAAHHLLPHLLSRHLQQLRGRRSAAAGRWAVSVTGIACSSPAAAWRGGPALCRCTCPQPAPNHQAAALLIAHIGVRHAVVANLKALAVQVHDQPAACGTSGQQVAQATAQLGGGTEPAARAPLAPGGVPLPRYARMQARRRLTRPVVPPFGRHKHGARDLAAVAELAASHRLDVGVGAVVEDVVVLQGRGADRGAKCVAAPALAAHWRACCSHWSSCQRQSMLQSAWQQAAQAVAQRQRQRAVKSTNWGVAAGGRPPGADSEGAIRASAGSRRGGGDEFSVHWSGSGEAAGWQRAAAGGRATAANPPAAWAAQASSRPSATIFMSQRRPGVTRPPSLRHGEHAGWGARAWALARPKQPRILERGLWGMWVATAAAAGCPCKPHPPGRWGRVQRSGGLRA